jgi:hypothetical protein
MHKEKGFTKQSTLESLEARVNSITRGKFLQTSTSTKSLRSLTPCLCLPWLLDSFSSLIALLLRTDMMGQAEKMQNKSREAMNKKNKGEVAPSTIEVYLLARHKDFFSSFRSSGSISVRYN